MVVCRDVEQFCLWIPRLWWPVFTTPQRWAESNRFTHAWFFALVVAWTASFFIDTCEDIVMNIRQAIHKVDLAVGLTI